MNSTPSIQYFVAQGFVVLVPNYRGSVGFGNELATFDRQHDMMLDLVGAAGYLKGLKVVDADRIGVIGFSFGGYLTLRCVTEAPELFAAAVDFSGASDVLKYYERNSSSPRSAARSAGRRPRTEPSGIRRRFAHQLRRAHQDPALDPPREKR